MATRTQKIKVGVFLFLCMTFLVIVLVLISGVQRYTTALYYVNFNESVTGLDRGGEVRYNGVPVGQVKEINIGLGGAVNVVLEIRKDQISEIRTGTKARLALRGITGIAYVELYGGGFGKVLPPGSEIPSEFSFISNVTANFPAILESLDSILVKTNIALGEPETNFKENLDGLFFQIEETTGVLNEFVREATTQTRTLTHRLNHLIENWDRRSSEITLHANTLLRNLDETTLNFNRRISSIDFRPTQVKINTMADQITTTTRELEAFLNETNKSVMDVEYSLLRALKQLRTTLLTAEELFENLERDPSSLIYGNRPPEKRRGSRQ